MSTWTAKSSLRQTEDTTPLDSSGKGEEEEKRENWGNKVQFILTCLGCAVGLGNIWRFPSRAYENGGSAFLVPYLICGLFFGLPVVYGEFVMGQYSGVSVVRCFQRYVPGFQGLGWAMFFQEFFISSYYTVALTWAAVYLAYAVSGQSYRWKDCHNKWNTDNCVAGKDEMACYGDGSSRTPYFNPATGNCSAVALNDLVSSTTEFFENHITKRSSDILDINEVNWLVTGALLIMWIVICISLIKGVKILGYLSYVTATLPYVIIVILFFRGITLPGAWDGVKFFLVPDFSMLWSRKIWSAALQQLAFSLTIGTGGLVTMASYNKFDNNCFRDALIVVLGDTLMSVIGGVAIFSVLGYMKLRTGKEIKQLVESGTSLAFIAYPEAMSAMPLPFVWEFFFFLMFMLLGFSTETVMVETLATCLGDQFPFLKRHRWLPVVGICVTLFCLGFIMCTDAGYYWFLLSDDFAGSVGLTALIALQFIIFAGIYGFKQISRDLPKMWGEPSGLWFGRQSPFWLFSWTVVCPGCALLITGLLCNREYPFVVTINRRDYAYPTWAEVLGWFSTVGPLLPLPVFFLYNWYAFHRQGKGFLDLFRNLPTLHSNAKRAMEARATTSTSTTGENA